MGQGYPTKEEVEKWKYESAHSPLHDHAFENHNRLICIADAYLALREELENCLLDVAFWKEKAKPVCEALTEQRRKMGAEIDELLTQKTTIQMAAKEEIDRLEAENQALRGAMNHTTKEAVMVAGDRVRLIGGINLNEGGKRTYFDHPDNDMIVDGFVQDSVAIIEPEEGLVQFVSADKLELVSD